MSPQENLEAHATDCLEYVMKILRGTQPSNTPTAPRPGDQARVSPTDTSWHVETDRRQITLGMTPELRAIVVPKLQKAKVKCQLRDNGDVLIIFSENRHLQAT